MSKSLMSARANRISEPVDNSDIIAPKPLISTLFNFHRNLQILIELAE
jgi:hypothetical protein